MTVRDNAIEVTAAGWYDVRAVAMVFDRYLSNDNNGTPRERVSRLV